MNQPAPTLHISPEIEDKIFHKHGVTGNKARELFEAHWRTAFPHPVIPDDPLPEGSDPRFVIQKWDLSEGAYWFVVFALISREEAELVTCFRRPNTKRWWKFK